MECCLHNYHTQTGSLLSAIDVPCEVLRCTNPNCNYEAHRTLLNNLYNDIIKSLKDAAEVIPTKANNSFSKYTVLGWNDLVRDSDQAARESFLFWRSSGSPRHGPLYDIMKIRLVKNMWLLHYQSLLNYLPGSPVNIKKINEYCSNVQLYVQMSVNVKEIQDTIHAMPVGKVHFKYANEKLHVLMSLLYSMLIHGFFTGCYDDYNRSPHN